MSNNFEIRNSTAEFLTFIASGKEDGVQVFYKNETIWATQQAIAILFDKNKSTISRHIANIYKEGDLQRDATVAKFGTVVNRGIRGEVEDEIEYYNLDAIISVGYLVNSVRATQFRQWATFSLQQVVLLPNMLKSMQNRGLRNIASFRIDCSRATLTN